MVKSLTELLNELQINGSDNEDLLKDVDDEDVNGNIPTENYFVNLKEISTHDYSVPPTRILFLLKSYEAICDRRYHESLYYETLSMGLWMRCRFSFEDYIRVALTRECVSNIVETTGNALVDFARREQEENAKRPLPTPIEPLFDEYKIGIQKLLKQHKELPIEWTVIQLCKQFNSKQWYSTHKEHVDENRPLNVTIIRHGAIDICEPITIVIPMEKYNFFECAFDASNKINSVLSNNDKMSANDLTTIILPNILYKLKQYIGHWIPLFAGASKCDKQKNIEENLLKETQTFCRKHTYGKRQENLLFLLARHIELIDRNLLEKAAKDIASRKNDESLIVLFFIEMERKYQHCKCCQTKNFPCILIVDDVLDHIPWEMNIPTQEYSRCSSFTSFISLFNKYKANISNGYYRKLIKHGNALINPDGTLDASGHRLKQFYDNCLPKWNYRLREIPTKDEMYELMSSADIFLYAGHGSGIQYVDAKKLKDECIPSVLFLYGCESMAMKIEGQTEALTAKKLLELSYCPVIIGALNIITDVWSDIVSIKLLRGWLTNDMSNWQMDAKLWPTKSKYVDILNKKCIKSDKSLLAKLAAIKSDTNVPVNMRLSIICRGLPIYNDE